VSARSRSAIGRDATGWGGAEQSSLTQEVVAARRAMPKQAPALPPEEAEGPFTIDTTPSVLPPKMRAASPAPGGVAGMLADAPGTSSNTAIANEPDASAEALKPGYATTLKLMLEISHEAALVSVLKKLVHFVNFVELEGGKSAGEARLKAEAKAMIERLQQAGAPAPSQTTAAVEERRSSQCSQVLDEASVLKRRVSTASDDGAAGADATTGLRRLDSKKILDVDHNTLESVLCHPIWVREILVKCSESFARRKIVKSGHAEKVQPV
jgi:hypothetical protein